MLISFPGEKAVNKDVCYIGSEALEKSVSQIMVMVWMI